MSSDARVAELDRRGYYVAVDVPRGATFALDTAEWTCDERFVGVKALTRGLHFVAVRDASERGAGERVGEFIDAAPGRVEIRRWDAAVETLGAGEGMRAEDAERARAATLEGRALDGRLAWYPSEVERAWTRLSGWITRESLRRCGVDCGTRVVADDPEAETRGDERGGVTPYFDNIQRAPTFTVDAVRKKPRGMTPAEVSAMNIDANARLAHALACFGDDGWRGLLGEFQLAFVLLMGLSSMAALEQWKQLAHVVCSCAETAVFDHPELYLGFVDALEAQLARAGEDFFVDDYTEDNFLRPCMVALMRIDVDAAPKREVTDMDVESTLDAISSKLDALARGVREKFDVDLIEEAREAKLADASVIDADEDAPVVVELSEGHYMAMDATDFDVDVESDAFKADAVSGAERMGWMRDGADAS